MIKWPSDFEAWHDGEQFCVTSNTLGKEFERQFADLGYGVDVTVSVPWADNGIPDIDGLLLRLRTWEQMREALEACLAHPGAMLPPDAIHIAREALAAASGGERGG